MRYIIGVVLFTVASLILQAQYSFAADFLQEGGLVVSPFLIEMDLEPGQTKSESIEVYNTSTSPKKLTYSIQDFLPAGERGQVRFLPVGESADPQYSLSSWIDIKEQPEFVLPPNGKTKVEFDIYSPIESSSGSRYAGILFAFDDTEGLKDKVQVTRKLGVLVIARNGRGTASGQLKTNLKNLYTSTPITLQTEFTNTGNMHLSPKGEFRIYNWLGRMVATEVINRDAQIVLPKNSRAFDSTFDKWLFGRYRIETVMFYGGEPRLEARIEDYAWFFPLAQTAGVVGSALGFVVLVYLLMKSYNRWLIRKHIVND